MKEGLIDEVGGMKEALGKLYELIGEEKSKSPEKWKIIHFLEKWTNRKNAKKEVETTNVSEQTRDKEKQE